jgi:hypothetical protein
MKDDPREQLINLARSMAKLEKAAKESLGFAETIHYRGVSFDVSRQFVIADLSPLAFFHLVEHIDEDGPQSAIARLYDRLVPLLTCVHQWTDLKRASDRHILSTAKEWLLSGDRPHVCKYCTAYVLGGSKTSLPKVGRTLP